MMSALSGRAALAVCVCLTGWLGAAASGQEVPRPEHPKPQFYRPAWKNLNGRWAFAFDFEQKGLREGWQEKPEAFDKTIVVPFCPESELSGIGYGWKGFIPAVWYRRQFRVPEDWDGQRVFLHFGGVDFESRAWVNGQEVGRHYGGCASFAFDITRALKSGDNDLVVYARDDTLSPDQPGGKQSQRTEPAGVKYTRVTGIWQTVWIEARPQQYIESVHVVPDVDGRRFILTPVFVHALRDTRFRATLLSAAGQKLASVESTAPSGIPVPLSVPEVRLWSPDDPYLYQLRFELITGGRAGDTVQSYAGLRKFSIQGNCFYLNDKPIFLRFVLDQGYYPDGIWTAPSDAALKKDIELSLAAGFNGARLHQKVFEERFHYWADRLGYLTWGEYADWGARRDFSSPMYRLNLQREWTEVVLRDRNHPSIVAWTPFNETRGAAGRNPDIHRRTVRSLYRLTHALDPTRPVNTTSGYVHILGDIFTVHDYTQSPEELAARYGSVDPRHPEKAFRRFEDLAEPYRGQPYVVDEYGGTYWAPEYATQPPKGQGRSQIGYGKTQRQIEELIAAQTRVLAANPNIAGFTYTQLTDIETEINGIYTYHRQPKFDLQRIRKAFQAPAAIEARR